MYNPITRRWSVIEPMSTLRSRIGVTVKDGLLFAIGGFNGTWRTLIGRARGRLRAPEDGRGVRHCHTTMAPSGAPPQQTLGTRRVRRRRMRLGVRRVRSVCASRVNYETSSLSSYDGITSLSTVEAYDAVAKKWTMQEPMRSQRSAAGIATIDGMIYGRPRRH